MQCWVGDRPEDIALALFADASFASWIGDSNQCSAVPDRTEYICPDKFVLQEAGLNFAFFDGVRIDFVGCGFAHGRHSSFGTLGYSH